MQLSVELSPDEEALVWDAVMDNVAGAVKKWAEVITDLEGNKVLLFNEPNGDWTDSIRDGVEWDINYDADYEQVSIAVTSVLVFSGLHAIVLGASRDIKCERMVIELVKHGVERLDEDDVEMLLMYGIFGKQMEM